jgi:hypothetical protein
MQVKRPVNVAGNVPYMMQYVLERENGGKCKVQMAELPSFNIPLLIRRNLHLQG